MQPRPIGILNLNKPAGMTSRRAVNVVQRLVKPAKVGHAGTLDPLATGVLVIAVGRATRLIEQIQSQSKRYRAVFQLGRRSNTDDSSGDVTVVSETPDVELDQIQEALRGFVGSVKQVPPAFSAVHVEGRRAYKLARRGKPVKLEPRPVEIYSIDLMDFDCPHVALDIHCGSGTYIRSIARDLGERLGCGALMSNLVRTSVGPYRLDDAVDPEKVTQETLADLLIPPRTAVDHIRQYRCSAAQLEEIVNGRNFELPCDELVGLRERNTAQQGADAPRSPVQLEAGETFVLLTPEGELAALAQYSAHNRMVSPKQVYCDVPE